MRYKSVGEETLKKIDINYIIFVPKIELILTFLAHVQNSEEKMPSLFRFDQDHLGIKTLFVKISLSRNFEAVSSRGLK